MTDAARTSGPLDRRLELAIVLAALVAGGGLRGYRLAEVGLAHFDEGIYAISGLWPYTGQFEPFQGYYSPPLFPGLIGLSNLLFGGPSDTAALAVSWLFSTGLIALAWRLGRSWCMAGGLIAAWFVALDGMQIAIGRTALTDATFTFLLVAAVGCLYLAISKGGTWVAAAGLASGLAWNTKYHGFLALVVAFGWVLDRPSGIPLRNAVSRWLFAASLALLLYLPWAAVFHVKHGYATLLAHQRGYFQGFAHLADNLASAACFFDQLATGHWAIVPLVAALLYRGADRWPVRFLGAGLAAILAAPGPVRLATVAAIACATMLSSARRGALGWMVLVLIILPALYTPYARLWLPTETALLLLLAVGMPQAPGWLARLAASTSTPGLRLVLPVGVIAVGIVRIAFAGIALAPLSPPVPRGYRPAAGEVAALAGSGSRPIAALVRPPLLYYLALGGVPVRRLAGSEEDFQGLQVGDRLLLDAALDDTPGARRHFERARQRLEPIARYPIEPSRAARLDDRKDVEPAVEAFRVTEPGE